MSNGGAAWPLNLVTGIRMRPVAASPSADAGSK